MMLAACATGGSATVVTEGMCKRTSQEPLNDEIVAALDQVPDPWQTWYGQLIEDFYATCPEWIE